MRPVLKARSDRAPVRGPRVPPVRAAGAEGRPAILGAIRLRVWAPILMRVLAFGLALLGLAGIGMAASRSPALSALAGASLGFDGTASTSPNLEVSAATTSVGAAAPAQPQPTPAQPTPAQPTPTPAQPAANDAGPTQVPDPCSKVAAAAALPAVPAGAQGPARDGVLADGRVVLNRASALELRRLPGVGAKRAELIVSLRQRLGRFKRPSDLLRIKGLGPRTLERMLPHLVLDAE